MERTAEHAAQDAGGELRTARSHPECIPGHRRTWSGNGYTAVAGAEGSCLGDSREALRTMILGIKAGKADHLL